MNAKAWTLALTGLLAGAHSTAQQVDENSAAAQPASESSTQWSGKWRVQWDERGATRLGPLAQANAVVPGTWSGAVDTATVLGEMRGIGRGWQITGTVQQQTHGAAHGASAWLNEAVLTHDAQSWQWSAGKKIVSWDVGYGFRPNDMVQQEERRTLVSTTPEGRPVLMAEHFNADTAWSWVWVNPTHQRDAQGSAEPALAARVYQRQGALDLHGFARVGAHTRASLGAALAWVANDATELHASWRAYSRADARRSAAGATELDRASPWMKRQIGRGTQAVVGLTWTHESQFSVMAEAWWDGTALSAAQWQDWRTRNAALGALAQHGAPPGAVAGNLAWQGDAFSASGGSLHQRNLYLRLSWEHEGWQPTFDVLYHPTDAGRLLTAGVLYKGDRYQVQAVLRASGGPMSSVMAQLPAARQANISYTMSF